MEYALRQTLVADAVSLQFRLPPPGVPAPAPRRSAAIAGGAPVVDTLVITSVWAVHLLRSLSQVGAASTNPRVPPCPAESPGRSRATLSASVVAPLRAFCALSRPAEDSIARSVPEGKACCLRIVC